MPAPPKTRVVLGGRTFFVSLTKQGMALVQERLVSGAGRPWEAFYHVARYPTKKGAPPGKFYAQVIAEASRKAGRAFPVPAGSPRRARGTIGRPPPA